jgi:DNA-directed RNA polymerase specialized sigma subunit, sigma54 homolog
MQFNSEMRDDERIKQITDRYQALSPLLDERARRQWVAAEAKTYGWGGRAHVSAATGISPNTISKGLRELQERERHPQVPVPSRLRRPGGGRKRKETSDPGIKEALERLVAPETRGDPMSPLLWTCKSTSRLAEELTRQGHPVKPRTVARLLKEAGYSLQGNRKTREGGQHPDRNAQFEYINASASRFMREGQPVVSVDTKKKELVGDFKNGGREWRPKGEPEEVRVHDFPDSQLGKAIPYGVYDVTKNEGWVSVGIDHDTARFASEAVWRWWRKMGRKHYGKRADKILIMADGGGSNGSRSRLWKVALQDLANRLGVPVHVCHFPPGTSKWNKIEHRMFSHITANWRGRPLVSHEVIVNLIGSTTTTTGLKVKAGLDANAYPTGIKVSDEEFESLNLRGKNFHSDWNYCLLPDK